MNIREIIRIAVNNLKSNRMRSLLTILGISVGITSIVFLVSLGYGLQMLSINKIASIEAINTLDVSSGKNSVKKIDNEFVESVKNDPMVEKVSPLLSLGFRTELNGKKTEAVGNFVDDNFLSLEGVEVKYGSFFSNSASDIVVSTALLKALDQEVSDAVSKTVPASVLISGENKKELLKDYKIIGVVQDDSTSFVYAPVESVQGELGSDILYNSLKVKVADQNNIPTVRKEIEDIGFSVSSIADTIDQVDRIFRIIQIVLALFGLIALIVASIGMFNTMTVALLERTRDIGIMKALGVRDRDVSRMFLAESSMIAFGGGLIGVISGWAISKIVNLAVNFLAKSVGGEAQTLFVTPIQFSVGIVVFSLFVGIATGFYPSRRASRLNPLDALRYE